MKTHMPASCFCGAVQLKVTGEPVAMGYCHCSSCRHWSAGPINAFSLWKPEAVQVTQGADNIGTYNKTPQSYRKWCKTCGGHIFTEHPGMGRYGGACCRHSRPTFHPWRARTLSRDSLAYARQTAKAEGPPEGNGRLGRRSA
jgi:hypothetical protein